MNVHPLNQGQMITTDRGRGGDFRSHGFASDMTPQPDGSFSETQLTGLLWDLRFEPDWRRQAEVEYAFYDGEQLNMATLRKMRENGFPTVIINMIAVAIDSVTGFEDEMRSDPKVMPENDEFFDVAEALNERMKLAIRMTGFNDEVGHAFKDCVIIGIGWIEVIRNPDPFGYPYLVKKVPWREMYWDYRSRAPDIISDARFLARRKWFDADVLMTHFPNHRDVIERSMGSYPHGWLNDWEDVTYDDVAASLSHTLEQEQRFTLEADEFRQQTRGRVPLYEILYKVPTRTTALRFRDDTVIEFNPRNPLHLRAIETKFAMVTQGVTQRWRQAYYTGDTRLGDRALRAERPHYIPFVCFRRDADGAVYGYVRRQKSPQESINSRHARMLYDLSSRRAYVDEDAVDDPDETAKELNKPNSMVVLKSDRRHERGIEVVPATDTSPITHAMLAESKMDIFGVTGITPEFQGQSQRREQSGLHFQSQVGQVKKVLGKPLRNYRNAKKEGGELMLHYIRTDLNEFDNYAVEVEGRGIMPKRTILLNARDPDGGPRTNEIMKARCYVSVGEVPESETYQQQKFQQLAEIVKSMPPDMQAPMMDLVVRAAALPDSEEILERMRQITGFGPEPRDPQKRAELAEQQQRQQEMQEAMEELQLRVTAAEAALKESQAAEAKMKAGKLASVDAEHTEAQTDLTEAKTLAEMAQIRQRDTELAIRRKEAEGTLVAAAARLEKEATAAERPDTPASGSKPKAKPKAKPKKK